MRSGRLHNKQNQRELSTESTNMDDQDEIENEPKGGRYADMDKCHVNHSEEFNFVWVVLRLILTAGLRILKVALIMSAVLAIYSQQSGREN
jgi:hypothetical protein